MEQILLFTDQELTANDSDFNAPLASRIRPQTLDDIVGQEHLIGEGKFLREMINKDQVSSLIFWGPPGVGKTTLAQIIAKQTRSHFVNFSAVMHGIKEIRNIMNQAEVDRQHGKRTIVFIDEIHRFNKAQQDAFLPYVEKGSIILIGATTENPSFEVNSALLSRTKVFVLKPLGQEDIVALLEKTLKSNKAFPDLVINIDATTLNKIAVFSHGDARNALNTLEMLVLNGNKQGNEVTIPPSLLEQLLGRKIDYYDKDGEEHYNLISALHKSMRNSDVDSSIYWLGRMLEAGEDPLYIARRLVRFASEDVGLADNGALNLAVNVMEACRLIGMPECNVHLTQCVIYLAVTTKSNAAYMACKAVKEDIRKTYNEPVPLHIRNAPTNLMKDLGYGKGYEYAHDNQDKLTSMSTRPESIQDHVYYYPTTQGNEARIKQRLEYIKQWKEEHSKD